MKIGDSVIRVAIPEVNVSEFRGVLVSFFDFGHDRRMAQVCDGDNCILTNPDDLVLSADGPEEE